MTRFILVILTLLAAAHSTTALAPLHVRHGGHDHGAPAASTTAPVLPASSPSTITHAHPPPEETPAPVASTTTHDHAGPAITTTTQPASQGTKPPSTSDHDHASHDHSSSSSGTATRSGSAASSTTVVTGGAGRALGRGTMDLAWMGAMAVAVGGPLAYAL
ncbi:hypothetical protein QBC34DRAFT_378626 [Podospora aff. communis PSN243]|uniref:Uncharacterized protein n=1 Tax=Podospora aff. communis PSN243 TaxID=3040156 RepID=A0AAV9GTG6_9PEZI|nr:hypothetical protein QBC34DRAFT_378626 [Podospora aff. communis PSN243]